MIVSSPQALMEAGIVQLRRFGYRPLPEDRSAGAEPDWAGIWEYLKADFATPQRARIPAWLDMPPRLQASARVYMRRRLLADRLFEDCQLWYLRLHAEGISTELVEAYALARDAYEESVFQFGDARASLEYVLTQTSDLM